MKRQDQSSRFRVGQRVYLTGLDVIAWMKKCTNKHALIRAAIVVSIDASETMRIRTTRVQCNGKPFVVWQKNVFRTKVEASQRTIERLERYRKGHMKKIKRHIDSLKMIDRDVVRALKFAGHRFELENK